MQSSYWKFLTKLHRQIIDEVNNCKGDKTTQEFKELVEMVVSLNQSDLENDYE